RRSIITITASIATASRPSISGSIIGTGALTVSVAVAVLPTPPSFELTALVVFTLVPLLVVVMLTAAVHELLAALAPPVIVNNPLPGTAVTVPPLQVEERKFGEATITPAGNVSENPTPVNAVVVFGLVSVNVSVEPDPVVTAAGANAFARVGGATTVM